MSRPSCDGHRNRIRKDLNTRALLNSFVNACVRVNTCTKTQRAACPVVSAADVGRRANAG